MRKLRVRGFTLVELLVVIAIIGVLVALLLPAIQACREAARRSACTNNLVQLVMAVHLYEGAFEALPAGVANPTGPIRNEAVGMHHGWLIRVLPYLEERNVYRLVDFSQSVYDPANAEARAMSLPVFSCPSAPGERAGASNYAGCHNDLEAPIDHDNLGVLFLNSHVPLKDITDGTSHTIFIGEKTIDAEDLGWMSGTRATLRNAGSMINAGPGVPVADKVALAPAAGASGSAAPDDPQGSAVVWASAPIEAITFVGGFGSAHPGGANFAFGDGRVDMITDSVSPRVLRQMATRAGNEVVDWNQY